MDDLIKREDVLNIILNLGGEGAFGISGSTWTKATAELIKQRILNLSMPSNISIQAVLEQVEGQMRHEFHFKTNDTNGKSYAIGWSDSLRKIYNWLQEQQTLQAKNEFAHRQLRKEASQVTDIRQII